MNKKQEIMNKYILNLENEKNLQQNENVKVLSLREYLLLNEDIDFHNLIFQAEWEMSFEKKVDHTLITIFTSEDDLDFYSKWELNKTQFEFRGGEGFAYGTHDKFGMTVNDIMDNLESILSWDFDLDDAENYEKWKKKF